MILGLTGAYCSGKNLAADILSRSGWHCVDVDRLGHRALELALPAVLRLLGPEARRPDGGPDRAYIGRRVFASASLLAEYEALVHPQMHRLLDEELAAHRNQALCINAAILYRLPQVTRCELIIELHAPLLLRMRRARRRDGLPWLRILDRMRRQAGLLRAGSAYKDRRIQVSNHGGRQELAAALEAGLAASNMGLT